MHDALVTYHREDRIGSLTLNRPDKRNALNLDLWRALDAAIAKAEEDEEARIVLVKGAGKSFCAGLDLSPENQIVGALSGQPSATQKMAFYRTVRRIQGIHTRLERLAKPTIAVIQGHCLGAGLELALCCDIRICSQDAVFSLPEATLAIITDVGGLQRLPRVVGKGFAREIAFRGHRFNAEYARSIGLVNHVCGDPQALETAAREMALEIAANPPLAVQGAKEVFLFQERAALEESLDYNAARSSMIMPSEDLFEAMAAFMQKRKGEFKGA
ncbi:MAG: enoyl-CoA hydratase [Deltaproteobacteria bacterium]|nr:enoyl-CoA hydratase [Deltaproteobacteria bacterium]